MLWIKAFHIVFMVTWFAGLFYLPRLFVYHCELAANDITANARFQVMERKLFAISSIGMVMTLGFGLWLWIGYWPMKTGWLHAKFALALGLVIYQLWLWSTLRRFATGGNLRSARFYRLMNEVPALFLIAMVLLAVVKPF